MAYFLDADVFIQAKNLHYGFDFCPAFWDWLIAQNRTGQVYSIEKVGSELLKGSDELTDWARNRGDDFFLPSDRLLPPALQDVSHWATQQNYTQGAVDQFFKVADYYLVAQAYTGHHTVVTHERSSDSNRKIKIPNVCKGLNIKCMAPHDMLRQERARFVLGSS